MTCPKCHGNMRQYERSGVTIDQCGECRGIFLDRGELEKLFEADRGFEVPTIAFRPDELAVMVDTFRPLELGEGGRACDDGRYAWSWSGRGPGA